MAIAECAQASNLYRDLCFSWPHEPLTVIHKGLYMDLPSDPSVGGTDGASFNQDTQVPCLGSGMWQASPLSNTKA